MVDGRDDERPHTGDDAANAAEPDFMPPPPPVPTSSGGWSLTDSGMIPEVPPDPDEFERPASFRWGLNGVDEPEAPPTTEVPALTRRSARERSGPAASRGTRVLIGVAIALVAVLALIGLFVLGTRLPGMLAGSTPTPSPTHSSTPTPTPTPTPTVMPKPTVAQAPGVRQWSTLAGGECLQPYTTPWAETFTVVECTEPHAAQMVYTNLLSADPAAPYPGATALAKQIPALCTAAGIIDLGAAGAYPDLQVQGSYPATAAQWTGGNHSYYCFASRTSHKPLTGSVAGPGPKG